MPLSFAPGWTDAHPDEFEQLLADRLEHPTPPECWRAQYDACVRFVEQVTPVEQIAAPTLVVHGDADRIVPYENGVALARRLPDARFEPFRGAGHLLFLEEAPRFNAVVASFLTG
jgi:pimeloyl-ACP methyl ester carboxylesterase